MARTQPVRCAPRQYWSGMSVRVWPPMTQFASAGVATALAHYLASRYDQALLHAIAVLQNRPPWWLGLIFGAASAAQIDRAEDASRMLDELERVRPGVTCESLSILPFATGRDREYLLDGLRKAGMPEGT